MTKSDEPELHPADELIGSLLTPAPSEEFSFLRVQPDGTKKHFRLRVRLLRVEEQHHVLKAAQAYAKEMGETPQGYQDLYKEAQAIELLSYSLCRSKPEQNNDGTQFYPQLFTSSDQLRATFTSAEMAQCLNMHEIVKAKYSQLNAITEEAIEEWAVRLSSPGAFYFLSQLDSDAWPGLIVGLAQAWAADRQTSGRPLTNSLDISESDPPTSTQGTGDFTELPEGHAVTLPGVHLPTGKLLTPEEAKEYTRKFYNK